MGGAMKDEKVLFFLLGFSIGIFFTVFGIVLATN